MIDAFETSVRITPDHIFFTYVDPSGKEAPYTYWQARIISAALARRLISMGVNQGDTILTDATNSPELVFLILASCYGGFSLAMLDPSLSDAEKLSRTLSLERSGVKIAQRLDHERLLQLLGSSRNLSFEQLDESDVIVRISGTPKWERSIMGERQDIIDDTVHFAEREAHLFDSNMIAVTVFTHGEHSKSRAVSLTWTQLILSSELANEALCEKGKTFMQERLPFSGRNSIDLPPKNKGQVSTRVNPNSQSYDCSWQCVYSLSNIRGFQILVRSVIGKMPLRIYETFDAEVVLDDCERARVTHISLSDRMLQDLLTVEEWRADLSPTSKIRISDYQCILINDISFNPHTVERALDLDARIFAGYGIPETSGLIAESLITSKFSGGMRLLEDYDVHIVDADEDGFGKLAVKGPGVFNGYLNTSTPFTVDHYFITGQTATVYDGLLYIKNKTSDMFESDGESIYPAEISEALRHIPGVSAVHVFGIADANHGNIPIAVIERSDPSLTAELVERTARPWLMGASMPRAIHIMDALPRTSNGRLDRIAIETMFVQTITIKKITLHHVRIPFRSCASTPYGELKYRDSVIVELEDAMNRVGLGECMSFDNEAFGSETLPLDVQYMKDVLSPSMISRSMRHPREIEGIFSKLPDIERYPIAAAAFECAVWDLYARMNEKPLWDVINQEYCKIQQALDGGSSDPYSIADKPDVFSNGADERDDHNNPDRTSEAYSVTDSNAIFNGVEATVASDAVIEQDSTPVVLANSHSAVSDGYKRLKICVSPGKGFASVRSIRRTFPNLLITLDANGSFTEQDIEQLRAYDPLQIGWIEEPISMEVGKNGSASALSRLDRLQSKIATPICIDDSYSNSNEAYRILDHPNLKCIAIKIAKFGGIEPTLRFIAKAKRLGCVIWMGGMYESAIGRRFSAAFETLPDILFPGDIEPVSRYFTTDITYPPYEAQNGNITLNNYGYKSGIGCILDNNAMSKVEVEKLILQ